MNPAPGSVFYEPQLAAMLQLGEKPRQGFATWKTAWKPSPNVCNSTVAIGLQATVVENGVRETYRARYYNPNTGRFLSEDPLGFAGSGMNLYAYASENPLRFNDPWGMCIATLNKAAQFVSNCMSSAATPVWDAAWMGGLAILVRALTLAILEITATEFVVPTLGLWGLLFYGLVVSFISEEALMLLAAVIGIAAIWYMCR